jgi:hypothetical protein
MIDDDDASDAFMVAALSPGGFGAFLVFLAIAIVFAVYASNNRAECSTRACPSGQSPKLMNHECLCVTRAQ